MCFRETASRKETSFGKGVVAAGKPYRWKGCCGFRKKKRQLLKVLLGAENLGLGRVWWIPDKQAVGNGTGKQAAGKGVVSSGETGRRKGVVG